MAKSPEWSDRSILVSLRFRLVAMAVFVVLFGIGVALLFVDDDPWTALGASLVAAATVFALVNFFVEPRERLSAGIQVAEHALEASARMFASRFEASIPEQTFPRAEAPSRQFKEAFAEQLRTSSHYAFKGVGGEFTAFRLTKTAHRPEMKQLDVALYLLDPLEERVVRVNAHRSISAAIADKDVDTILDEGAQGTKDQIYRTLVALFDMRGQLETTVYLHTDLPFCRVELFDAALFLSYYAQPNDEFPGTFLYAKTTHAYDAYRMDLELTRLGSTRRIVFGVSLGGGRDRVTDTNALEALLDELGCSASPDELRVQIAVRNAELEDSLTFSADALF